jgi:hypothetical protein
MRILVVYKVFGLKDKSLGGIDIVYCLLDTDQFQQYVSSVQGVKTTYSVARVEKESSNVKRRKQTHAAVKARREY